MPNLGPYQSSKSQFRRLDRIEAKPVYWLVRGIPIGHLTLLAGEPGVGKSHAVFDIAARISSGRRIPRSKGKKTFVPKEALLIALEDDAASIRLRLEAASADLKRIRFIGDDGISTGQTIASFVDILEAELAKSPNVKLVVVDTLSALAARFGLRGGRELDAITALTALARKYNVAVVIITHVNKSRGGSSVAKILGPTTIAAAPRSIFVVERGPSPEVRYLTPAKSNLADDSRSLRFRIASTEIRGQRTSKIVWSKKRFSKDDIAKQLFSTTDEGRANAALELFARGRASIASKDIEQEANRLGITKKKAMSVLKGLGYSSKRVGGAASKGHWVLQKAGAVSGEKINVGDRKPQAAVPRKAGWRHLAIKPRPKQMNSWW